MSTFSGKFVEKEFEEFSIDNFLSHTYDCKAFFLSHYHTDHMRGIEDPSFHALFERSGVYFYCSSLTKSFIVADGIKIPHYKIIILSEFGTSVEIKERGYVRVTPFPAGHCPGSVMLLFEGFNKRVLYTGDIRLTVDDLTQMRRLHISQGCPIPIDSLYFDSTFASENYEHFPSRQESLSVIEDLTRKWLSMDENNRVAIDLPASIGMEYLMIALIKNLKLEKVYVPQSYYSRFDTKEGSFLLQNVTNEYSDNIKVHFCPPKCGSFHCFVRHTEKKKLLTLKPTALRFKKDLLVTKGMAYYDGVNTVRVIYSSHCSFSELRKIINYLRPVSLFACVLNDGETTKDVGDRISNAMELDKISSFCSKRSLHKEFSSENVSSSLSHFSYESNSSMNLSCDR